MTSWGIVDDGMLSSMNMDACEEKCVCGVSIGGETGDKLSLFRLAANLQAEARWHAAIEKFSEYINLSGNFKANSALADALYARAACYAKVGQCGRALIDLRECIKVGPEDEQMTEDGVSKVASAKVALWVLLSACMGLEEEAHSLESVAAASSTAVADPDADNGTCYEGSLWRAPLTQIDIVIDRALCAGRTPLLLDRSGTADVSFLYEAATIIEAKALVLDARTLGLEAIREKLRRQLVHAMRHGHTLVVRLADSAPDFANSYCADDTFPAAVFDSPAWPSARDAARDALFGAVVRPEDTAESGGRLMVPPSFRVLITCALPVDSYEAHLQGALPHFAEGVQAIELYELSAAARGAELGAQPGASNTGPLADVVADWGGSYSVVPGRTRGDAPKSGQLQGDRMSLFESS